MKPSPAVIQHKQRLHKVVVGQQWRLHASEWQCIHVKHHAKSILLDGDMLMHHAVRSCQVMLYV